MDGHIRSCDERMIDVAMDGGGPHKSTSIFATTAVVANKHHPTTRICVRISDRNRWYVTDGSSGGVPIAWKTAGNSYILQVTRTPARRDGKWLDSSHHQPAEFVEDLFPPFQDISEREGITPKLQDVSTWKWFGQSFFLDRRCRWRPHRWYAYWIVSITGWLEGCQGCNRGDRRM